MHPYTETDVITHLRDDFDGDYPWRGYWCLRFGDDDFPGNLSDDFYFGYPMPPKTGNPYGDWEITADGLYFPTYDWLETAPATLLGQQLLLKIRTRLPPFRFELGWKWTTNLDATIPTANNHGLLISAPYLGQINVPTGTSRIWQVIFNHVGNLSGNCSFDAATYNQGQEMRYYFQVNSDMKAYWGLQENEVTPANTTIVSEWLPDTSKTTAIDWVIEMNSFYPRYLPIRIYPTYGGTLRYLEARIFNHEDPFPDPEL